MKGLVMISIFFAGGLICVNVTVLSVGSNVSHPSLFIGAETYLSSSMALHMIMSEFMLTLLPRLIQIGPFGSSRDSKMLIPANSV